MPILSKATQQNSLGHKNNDNKSHENRRKISWEEEGGQRVWEGDKTVRERTQSH